MNTRGVHAAQITAELLLQLFDLPISFHRCLVPISGGVNAALMLSQAIWATEQLAAERHGAELSRWEQETARRSLRNAGFLEERRVGMPAKLWFRVRPDRVWRALQAQAADPVGVADSVRDPV